jgi:predicted metal-dependent peptidase
MKVTFEVGRDEELRKDLLDIIRTEVRSITGQEIRDMVREHLQASDVAARVASAFKELVNTQITNFTKGYGRQIAEQMFASKLDELATKQIAELFEKRAPAFVQKYVNDNLTTLSGAAAKFAALIKKAASDE